MFQLTGEEAAGFEITDCDLKTRAAVRRYTPCAFTEHGVTMLASVLQSSPTHPPLREVSASPPISVDEAIRVGTKLAIDAGDLTRARALLDLLDAAPIAFLTRRKSS